MPLGYQSLTVGQIKTDYLASLDARRISAMFTDGRNRTMFDRNGARSDIDIGAWWRRWTLLTSRCSEYFSLIGLFDMPFVRHANEEEYFRNLRS